MNEQKADLIKIENSHKLKEFLVKEKVDLDLKEWDFSECSEDERKACFYYEYLRENEELRRRCKKVEYERWVGTGLSHDRKNQLEEFERWFRHEFNFADHQQEILLEFMLPPWPDTPWLGLGYKEKNFRLRVMSAPGGNIIVGPQPNEIVNFLKQPLSRHHMYGLLLIQDGASLDEIIVDFGKEIRAYADRHPEKFEKRKLKINGWKRWLDQLGAYRTRKLTATVLNLGGIVDDEVIVGYRKNANPNEKKVPYAHEREFSEAAEAAEARIKSMFEPKNEEKANLDHFSLILSPPVMRKEASEPNLDRL